ncbi:uncharacterized protein LOC124529748 [Vanessa cardui]|uniref:uncharacterized protein LOC124529748 n=1 Tax=Vanessa cardui TaxID=171605 RepID=UPI001F14275F|nr:uncharacterized protein LOC124529748 [Vanessa cardui]
MQEAESNLITNYNALKENPQFLLNLINKYVKVDIIKNTTIYGFVHSIDPIKYSIIILEHQNGTFQTTVIPGHAIIDVSEVNQEINVQLPKRENSTTLTESSISERKQKLISWLKQNLLPVTESEDNIAFGNVLILPPYNINDICTDNVMVATQVKNIINKMPENF